MGDSPESLRLRVQSDEGCEWPGEESGFMGAESSYADCSTASASSLLAEALAGARRVDFPLVTAICDRACGDDGELEDLVNLVAVALQGPAEDMSPKLKALTVAHELLYDQCAC